MVTGFNNIVVNDFFYQAIEIFIFINVFSIHNVIVLIWIWDISDIVIYNFLVLEIISIYRTLLLHTLVYMFYVINNWNFVAIIRSYIGSSITGV